MSYCIVSVPDAHAKTWASCTDCRNVITNATARRPTPAPTPLILRSHIGNHVINLCFVWLRKKFSASVSSFEWHFLDILWKERVSSILLLDVDRFYCSKVNYNYCNRVVDPRGTQFTSSLPFMHHWSEWFINENNAPEQDNWCYSQ